MRSARGRPPVSGDDACRRYIGPNLLLFFGGGGFFLGGPAFGGGGIGLILLACLIIYLMGGLRTKN